VGVHAAGLGFLATSSSAECGWHASPSKRSKEFKQPPLVHSQQHVAYTCAGMCCAVASVDTSSHSGNLVLL
jgi:hypothetical protein